MKTFKSVFSLLSIVIVFAFASYPAMGQMVQSGNIILDLSKVEREYPTAPINNTDTELLTNGGFETGTMNPWYHDGSWSISTHQPHTGTYCAYDIGNHWIRQDFTATPANQIVSVTLWERQPEAQISAIDFFYTNLPYSEDLIWLTTNWQQYNVTNFIEPNGIVNGIRIWGYSGGGGQPDETYIDDISVQTAGVPRVEIELAPDSAVSIPATGGIVNYSVVITNLETGIANFDAWTMVKRVSPDTVTIGPLLLRSLTLGGGATLTRAMTQNFPGTAPNGVYYFYGKVGDYPTTVVDLDSFMINKGVFLEGSNAPIHNWEFQGWDDNTTSNNTPPSSFLLHPCYPNPFNASVAIRFEMRDASPIDLRIFDISGREVWSMVNGQQSMGEHTVVWDAEGLPSGIYFVRLVVDSGQSVVQKVVLTK
jgi:hypothetical protein